MISETLLCARGLTLYHLQVLQDVALHGFVTYLVEVSRHGELSGLVDLRLLLQALCEMACASIRTSSYGPKFP